MSRISVTLDGWSLTKTRVRPSAVCTRRRMMSPSSSSAFSVRIARAGWLRGTSKTADTWPWAAPWRTSEASPRAPSASDKRIKQNGFAGAGLAGQHGKAGRKIDVQPLDQDDIADRQAGQHLGGLFEHDLFTFRDHAEFRHDLLRNRLALFEIMLQIVRRRRRLPRAVIRSPSPRNRSAKASVPSPKVVVHRGR